MGHNLALVTNVANAGGDGGVSPEELCAMSPDSMAPPALQQQRRRVRDEVIADRNLSGAVRE
jgi:hypothetical protein